jgi:4a-hydroxytetrahydrobiopterin dehydratase
MNYEEIQKHLSKISGWILKNENKSIFKEFNFKDFVEAINFVKIVAEIAEKENHHPDIHIFYNKVLIELSTHDINGLSENDFILAAKIDANN